tara:strand:+ start:5337 stop:6380 length:1044 start_codon:yes stop_codon:yes gene_type:complete
VIEELEYYSIPAISNSSLASINPEQGGSPAMFKKEILDRDGDNTPKLSFENGKIVHKYVENKDAFVVSEFEKPTDTIALWVLRVFAVLPKTVNADNFIDQLDLIKIIALDQRDGAYGKFKDETALNKFVNEGMDYISYLFLERGDSIIMTPAQKEMMDGIITSIDACPGAYKLLFDKPEFGSTDVQKNEEAIYWKREVSIPGSEDVVEMNMKSLLDRFILKFVDGGIQVYLIDFKTTGGKIPLFGGAFKGYRYYRQLAFYTDAIIAYIEQNYPDFTGGIDFTYYIVAVETHGLYQCRVLKISQKWIGKGTQEMERLLRSIAYHQSTGQWSRTHEEVEEGFIVLPFEE